MREPNEGHRDGYPCYWCSVARLEVTHEDLEAETKTVLKTLAREMDKVRDQLYHLNKTHTVALMAAQLYASLSGATVTDFHHAANMAKNLYREVQKTLEIDDTIVTGHIPAA